ncbi:MAG: tRNA preQ1(34) S-adenosylmethionine ribosyltransferase-isomerase QueA [Opitutus sp.]
MPSLPTQLFDYTLPEHLIAQHPSARRDQSRLFVVDRASNRISHRRFCDLPEFLQDGDILFRNNAAVLPARLHAIRPSGGRVECFLLGPLHDSFVWRCLVKPGKKLPVGAGFEAEDGSFCGEVLKKVEGGTVEVRFKTKNSEPITEVANRLGQIPLPPYIARHSDQITGDRKDEDRERYQTVYADPVRQVAVAAPTAGLHFTPELLQQLSKAGVQSADLTLHVGLGTFKPIAVDHIEAHAIHREIYEIPAATQRALFPPHRGRRVAVGTTTVRSIEDFLASHREPVPGDHAHVAEASIFIYPPRSFLGVDALITNFHQPRSTLLCLVAAFLSPNSTDGIQRLKAIYQEAIDLEYRFFSYGDAMLIL